MLGETAGIAAGSTPSAARLELTLENSFPALGQAAIQAHQFFTTQGLASKAIFRADLVFEEVITNIIRYGHDDGGTHTIKVAMAVEAEKATLIFEDNGREFDPLAIGEPESSGQVDDIPIGGRGLGLVRMMIQSGDYQRREGRNRLVLVISG